MNALCIQNYQFRLTLVLVTKTDSPDLIATLYLKVALLNLVCDHSTLGSLSIDYLHFDFPTVVVIKLQIGDLIREVLLNLAVSQLLKSCGLLL